MCIVMNLMRNWPAGRTAVHAFSTEMQPAGQVCVHAARGPSFNRLEMGLVRPAGQKSLSVNKYC